jgi:hypothetical protein
MAISQQHSVQAPASSRIVLNVYTSSTPIVNMGIAFSSFSVQVMLVLAPKIEITVHEQHDIKLRLEN